MIDQKTDNFAKRAAGRYGVFVSRHPYPILFISVIAFVIAMNASALMPSETMDNRGALPEGIEVIEVFSLVEEKFPGGTESMRVALELNFRSQDYGVDDIREADILRYADVLAQRIELISDVTSVSSVTSDLKAATSGVIPNDRKMIKELLSEMPSSENFVSSDYELLVISVGLSDDYVSQDIYAEILQAINELRAQEPPYVDVYQVGTPATDVAISSVMSGDMGKTTGVSMVVIFVIMLILFASFRQTIIALMTVIFGLIWAFGLGGVFGLPMNELVSGAASMILGIGIDFGIQTVTRYRQEREEQEGIEDALQATLAGIFIPLATTTAVGIVGFIAMGSGQLTFMQDLGTMMIYGIIACLAAAMTIVPSILTINARFNLKLKSWRQR